MNVKSFKKHIKYIVKPAGDGGYNVLKIDLTKRENQKGRVDIHSYHDNMEEAIEMVDDLESPYTQMDLIGLSKTLK
jgi:hypothetical protein